MKKTLIITAALGMASVASATDFKWDGDVLNAETQQPTNNWTDSGNWKDSIWTPTAWDCDVYIGTNGANSGDVTWNSQHWDLASLTIAGDSSATLTGWGDVKIETIKIEAGSSLAISSDGALGGFDGTVTDGVGDGITNMILSGSVSADTAPLFTMKTSGIFWGGENKTLVLTGTLDLSALPNSIGSVTLVDFSAGAWYDGGLTVDYSGLTLTGDQYGDASLSWVGTKSGTGKLVLSYVPEPTTATLSLLALAGLAARRRRK